MHDESLVVSFQIDLTGPSYSRTEIVHAGAPPLIVGRDAGASIHVPDPDRSISRKHLSLDCADTGVRVVVLSTVNGISTPNGEIQCGQQVILRPGESAQLGTFTLLVSGMTGGSGLQVAGAPAQHADPFVAYGGINTPHASIFDNAFLKTASPPPAPLAAERDVLDAFSPAAGPRGFSAGPPMHGPGPAPMGAPADGNGFASDPLAAFGSSAQPHQASHSRGIDDFLGLAGASGGIASGLGASSMLIPQAHPEARRLAVDHVHDFNLPVRAMPSSPLPAPAPIEPPARQEPQPPAMHQSDHDDAYEEQYTPATSQESDLPAKSWADFSSEWMAPKSAPTPVDAFDGSDPFSDAANTSMRDPFSDEWSAMPGWQRLAGAPGPVAPASTAAPGAAAAQAPLADQNGEMSALPSAQDDLALAALCRGLGVEGPSRLDPLQWEQMGAAMRTIVQGLTELMNTRAEIKKELRAADRTMLGAQDNNPLKGGMAQEEILQYLLFNPTGVGGYMKVDKALDEAINDLRAHEFASIAAVRAAVDGTVRDFEPEKLRAILTKGKSKLPQFLDNARLWDMYTAHYENKSAHMADWLEQLFNRFFMPTYSRESERLRSKPKPKPRRLD